MAHVSGTVRVVDDDNYRMVEDAMMYWVWLHGNDGLKVFRDGILPGLIPDRVFDLMVADVVDKQLDLCRLCDVQGSRCHVIEEGTGRELCPVLFADAVNPPWKVSQLA